MKNFYKLLLFALILISANRIFAQQFTEQASITLQAVDAGSVIWGDYDNDGDLDILLVGFDSGNYSHAKIYRNNGNDLFEEQTSISLTSVGLGSVSWSDYDNDGDLDILLTGNSGTLINYNTVSKIYKNNGDNSFSEQLDILLPGVFMSSIAWTDFDKDGDLDFILAGNTQNGEVISKIYLNIDNNFNESSIILKGGQNITIADYNNDLYPDILITGKDINGIKHSTLYKNNSNPYTVGFTEQTDISFTALSNCSADWGDYDNDGDLDIVLNGDVSKVINSIYFISKIYKNNGDNSFTEQTDIILIGARYGSVDWGDYDNDGDLDLLLTGAYGTGYISKIYKNNGNSENYGFTEQTDIIIEGVYSSSSAWGDYDNDGDLDILITGYGDNHEISKIYKNQNLISNSNPEIPTNLQNKVMGTKVKLFWDPAHDIETPSQSLSYNVRVGRSPGEIDIVSPMSDTTNGYRRIPGLGNTYLNNEFFLNNLDTVTYYWSVQTIDNGFLSSDFSNEKSFTITPDFTEQTNISLTDVGYSSIAWGDYDNDGDLDILLTGFNHGEQFSKIYENNGNNSFTERTDFVLSNVHSGSSVWGDYDNDGDLDILLTGYGDNGQISKIYKNNNGISFIEQTEIILRSF